jgi:hypothetical protein
VDLKLWRDFVWSENEFDGDGKESRDPAWAKRKGSSLQDVQREKKCAAAS